MCICVLRHAEKVWKKPVFGFKNASVCPFKTSRVYIQNVPVCAGTTRRCVSTCACGAGTHGDALHRHEGRFERTHGPSPLPPLPTHTDTHTHQTQHQRNITRRQTEKERGKMTKEEREETRRRRKRKKNSVLTCTRGGIYMSVSLCSSFFTRKRTLEHVRS